MNGLSSFRGIKACFRGELLSSAAVICATMLLLPASARAQVQSVPQPANQAPTATAAQATPPADERPDGLEDIVVTAQRRSQAISQVPISVQAISPVQVQRLGAVDTTALTQLSPSITFRPGYSANSSSFAIRGVTSIAIEGGIQPSTAVLLDGVPIYRQGEMVADLIDLQGIEILRGPQGTLFGKNSSAGVIAINTNNPTAEFSGSAQAGLTTDDEYYGNAVLNVPLGSKVQARITGFYRDQDDLVNNRGIGSDVLGARTYGVAGKLKFEITPDLDLLLSANYTRRKSSFGQYFLIVGQSNPTQAAAQAAVTGFTPSRGNLAQNFNGLSQEVNKIGAFAAQFDWRISDTTSIVSITSYRMFRSDNVNDVDGTPAGADLGKPFTPEVAAYPFIYSVRGGPVRQPERTNYGSQELRLHYEGARADLVTGAFYQTAKNRTRANTGLIGLFLARFGILAPFYNNSFTDVTLKNDSAAIFADLTYKLTDTLTVFGGARYTHETLSNDYARTDFLVNAARYDPITGNVSTTPALTPPFESIVNTAFLADRSDDNISGRVGIQFRPSAGQNYYASYNRGYKGPAAQTGRVATAATGLIAPEIAQAYEIGTKQRLFDERLSFSLSAYTQKIRNIQQTIIIPGTSNTQLADAGDLKSKGVEFEVQALVARNFRLSGGISYTDAKYSGDGRVTCFPGQTAAQGCIGGSQALGGQRAINAPKWRYNAATDYSLPLSDFGTLDANVNWAWSSPTQYGLDHSPFTREPSHGFLNASLTLASRAGWEVQVYGRNLTNEFYYGTLIASDGVVGLGAGYLPRDFKRYGGLSFKYSF